MNWISVKDRLPKQRQEIMFIAYDHIYSGNFYPDNKSKSDLGFYDYCCSLEIKGVSYWSELPESPKE